MSVVDDHDLRDLVDVASASNEKAVYGQAYAAGQCPPDAVLYATLPLSLRGLQRVMNEAQLRGWLTPVQRYDEGISKKRRAMQNRQQVGVPGRPAKDGVLDPLIDAYKQSVRKWYSDLRKNRKEDPNLEKLQIMLIETTNTFCTNYRQQLKTHYLPEQGGGSTKAAAERLHNVLAHRGDMSQAYVNELKRTLKAWWKTEGHSNNIMTKKLYEVPVKSIFRNRQSEDCKGMLTIMMPKESNAAALAMFSGVCRRDVDDVLGTLFGTTSHAKSVFIQPNATKHGTFSKLSILSLTEKRAWRAANNIIDVFCSFAVSPDVDAALSSAVATVKKRDALKASLVTTDKCNSLGGSPSFALVATAQSMQRAIDTHFKAKMGTQQGCVLLSVDTRKGCQVHYYRPKNQGKVTLSFNPNTGTDTVQVRDALSIAEARALINATTSALSK